VEDRALARELLERMRVDQDGRAAALRASGADGICRDREINARIERIDRSKAGLGGPGSGRTQLMPRGFFASTPTTTLSSSVRRLSYSTTRGCERRNYSYVCSPTRAAATRLRAVRRNARAAAAPRRAARWISRPRSSP